MKKIIVIGGLNIDFLGVGVNKIVGEGELSYGGKFEIKPGGKSRNIAQMMANQMQLGEVVMIGKTAKDEYGLYNIPLESLKNSGVDISSIIIDDSRDYNPGVALIPIDKNGNNQIYVLPGVNDNFKAVDIQENELLFKEVGDNDGLLVLSLELPSETAIAGIQLANKYGLRVILDPGGMIEGTDYSELLQQNIFLIKPNEHEVHLLTGVEVVNFETAKTAAEILMQYGIKKILITIGEKGAYFFDKYKNEHYEIPYVDIDKTEKDETGCGDQTIATLSVNICDGCDIDQTIKRAILSGTLQFYRAGVTPLNKEDLGRYY